ncbi:hypothetical protein DBR33_02795 [Stenotrophomonas sp. HMWF022]|nr:hypothetical protein DBR33_02795 [Stenotrophomonas sp. HMWF022]
MRRMDVDSSLPGDLVELELSDEEFRLHLGSGTTDAINVGLSKLIDEYEDESVEGGKELALSLALLEGVFDATGLEAVGRLVALNRLAIERDTGVFFYL